MHLVTQASNSQAYQTLKMQHARLEQHLQLQLLRKGGKCAAGSGLQAGAESRWGSLGGRAPHQGPCAALS